MTDAGRRLYLVALAILILFVSWAFVAARPWAAHGASAPDPKSDLLARREAQLRHRAIVVNRVVKRRWSHYRAALHRRELAIAAAKKKHRRDLVAAWRAQRAAAERARRAAAYAAAQAAAAAAASYQASVASAGSASVSSTSPGSTSAGSAATSSGSATPATSAAPAPAAPSPAPAAPPPAPAAPPPAAPPPVQVVSTPPATKTQSS
jgi:cobalamin biosynthesis Mg chelatase CobN